MTCGTESKKKVGQMASSCLGRFGCSESRYRRTLQCDESRRFATGAAEAGKVGLHCPVLPDGCKHGLQDREGCGVGGPLHAVVHPLSFPPCTYDASFPQVCEVP